MPKAPSGSKVLIKVGSMPRVNDRSLVAYGFGIWTFIMLVEFMVT
jgi:hypothetical protein